MGWPTWWKTSTPAALGLWHMVCTRTGGNRRMAMGIGAKPKAVTRGHGDGETRRRGDTETRRREQGLAPQGGAPVLPHVTASVFVAASPLFRRVVCPGHTWFLDTLSEEGK